MRTRLRLKIGGYHRPVLDPHLSEVGECVSALFNRQIAELGYEQFFSLSLLGVAIVLPIGVFRAYLRKRENRKSEKIGNSTN